MGQVLNWEYPRRLLGLVALCDFNTFEIFPGISVHFEKSLKLKTLVQVVYPLVVALVKCNCFDILLEGMQLNIALAQDFVGNVELRFELVNHVLVFSVRRSR